MIGRLRWLYFLHYAGVGTFLSYFAPYLRGLGFSGEQIGAVTFAQQAVAAPAALIFARDALLDLNRRLAFELTYPIDCPVSEAESFYAALSTDNSTEEVLHFSDRLWPLARANFIAHISSHRPADPTILPRDLCPSPHRISALKADPRAALSV